MLELVCVRPGMCSKVAEMDVQQGGMDMDHGREMDVQQGGGMDAQWGGGIHVK